jgi:hypothetical protein
MVYIINRTICPSHKANEWAGKYIEQMQTNPPDESLYTIIANGVKQATNGIIGITVSEVKEGKLAEAVDHITRSNMFYLEIEGLDISSDIFYNPIEALDVLGLKPPI